MNFFLSCLNLRDTSLKTYKNPELAQDYWVNWRASQYHCVRLRQMLVTAKV